MYKNDDVASTGTVPISEDWANVAVVGLIVVVRNTVVEVHVPCVRTIILRRRPIVVRLILSPVLYLLEPAPSGIGRRSDAYGSSRRPLSKQIQLTPSSLDQTDSRKRYPGHPSEDHPTLAPFQRHRDVIIVVAVFR